MDAAALAAFIDALHGGVTGALGAAVPVRAYASTRFGAAAPRWFVLTIDPHALHPLVPRASNRIDVGGTSTADLEIRLTPTLAVSTSGATVRGATIDVRLVNPSAELRDLHVDIGIRLDGPIAPPDDASDAAYLVLDIDATTQPLARSITIDAALDAVGTAGTVGAVTTTAVTVHVDSGGATAAVDHPVRLRFETHTGSTSRRDATVVIPVGIDGLPLDLPVDLGLGGIIGGVGGSTTTAPVVTSINVPGSVVTAGVAGLVELERPGLRPHLDQAGAELTWRSEIRAIEDGEPVTADRFDWRAPYDVEAWFQLRDKVSAEKLTLWTSALPHDLAVDMDPRRADRNEPHVKITAESSLEQFRMQREQPQSTEDGRMVAVAVDGVPTSVGLRLETAVDSPLRVIASAAGSVTADLPAPLGAAAVLVGRDLDQLPPLDGSLRPTAVPFADQTVAVDLDDVPSASTLARPMTYASLRALRYGRIEANTRAPVDEPVHADEDGGLVVHLKLAEDRRDGDKDTARRPRALRLQRLAAEDAAPTIHDRLLVRVGELPDELVVDMKAVPGPPSSFGLRIWGECRYVQVLQLETAASAESIDSAGQRFHLAIPKTAARYTDVTTGDGVGTFVDATEPISAEVAIVDPGGIGRREGEEPDVEPFNVLVAAAQIAGDLGLPAVADGLQVDAGGAGVSSRVAVAYTGVPLLALRPTPQVAIRSLAADRATSTVEALSARTYGVTHLRQGAPVDPPAAADEDVTHLRVVLHPDRVNRSLRIAMFERLPEQPVPRPSMKARIAFVPPEITLVNREAPFPVAPRPANVTNRRPSKLDLRLSEPSGAVTIWSEPLQRPHDGPRDTATVDGGVGVSWLGIDALPRRLIITPLFSERYAPGLTRPGNFMPPADWTRDGLRLQSSDDLHIRDFLQVAWDRDESATGRFAWGLGFIRRLELFPDPVADGAEPPALHLWNPGLRPAAGGDFAEPASGLGIRVDDGLRVTLDLDKFEQLASTPNPRWDALPGDGWVLLAEVQLDRFGGEVSLSEEIGAFDPVEGGNGPGLWWVRSTDKWPGFLGGGSVAFGNNGGPPFHATRLFP